MDELFGFLLQLVIELPFHLIGEALTSGPTRPRSESTLAPPPPAASRRPISRPVLSDPIPKAQFVGRLFVTKIGRGTRCLVCRHSLEEDVVSCSRCATLHHQDCWDYNRGCSTYGCRAPVDRQGR